MKDTYSSNGPLTDTEATIAAEVVNSLTAKMGRLSTREMAEAFIAASRPKTSRTHDLFEWDDAKAAAIQRRDRANRIIASVYVVFEETPELPPVRGFPVVTVDGKKGPTPMRRVLGSPDMTAAVLEQAKADLEQWRRRYERLAKMAEMRSVFAAIEKVVAPKKGKRKAA